MHVNSIETILKIVFSLHERTHYALHQLNQSSMYKLINILLENARIEENICNATDGNNIKHLDYMQFWRDRCDQTNGKSVYGLKLAPFSRHWLLLMLFGHINLEFIIFLLYSMRCIGLREMHLWCANQYGSRRFESSNFNSWKLSKHLPISIFWLDGYEMFSVKMQHTSPIQYQNKILYRLLVASFWLTFCENEQNIYFNKRKYTFPRSWTVHIKLTTEGFTKALNADDAELFWIAFAYS